MSWLLRLYPAAWRRRFGAEVAEHLAEEPFRLRTAVDLVAGAVDAWANPGTIPKTPEPEGVSTMIRAARCMSSDISTKHAAQSAGVMLGLTLALTVLSLTLQATFGPHFAIDALTYSAFFIALLVSSNLTYLRPYSPTARYAIIGVGCVGWYLFFLGVTWVGAQL
ncbi:MAG: hypothetical protein AAGD86_02465 [Pseudomonadota bacterium]